MLSKDEVEAEKASMRAIDARPIKKVAEAKQRKRKRLQVAFPPLPSSHTSSIADQHMTRNMKVICCAVCVYRAHFYASRQKHALGRVTESRMLRDLLLVSLKGI